MSSAEGSLNNIAPRGAASIFWKDDGLPAVVIPRERRFAEQMEAAPLAVVQIQTDAAESAICGGTAAG